LIENARNGILAAMTMSIAMKRPVHGVRAALWRDAMKGERRAVGRMVRKPGRRLVKWKGKLAQLEP
jgi:hypothetical protein